MRTKLTSLSELFDKPDGFFKWSTERNVDVEKLFEKKKRSSARRSPTAGNRGQGSKWLRRTTRRRIYTRDGWQCVWCTVKVEQPTLPEDGILVSGGIIRQASIDHVVPRSRGGSNRPDNLITCCASCNAKRNDRSVPAFARALEAEDNYFGRLARFIVQRVRASQRRKLPELSQ